MTYWPSQNCPCVISKRKRTPGWPTWRRRSVPDSGDGVFRALADPTRRRILDLLADRGALTVSELAAQFPGLVASGISKHLMGLRAAGLVAATRQGRRQSIVIVTAAITPSAARTSGRSGRIR